MRSRRHHLEGLSTGLAMGLLSLTASLLAHPVGLSPWPCEGLLSGADPRDFSAAAERVIPSVLSVASGERVNGRFELKQSGTGVIWEPGVILTNAHVIRDQPELRARSYDRRVVLLRELARSDELDIALLVTVNAGVLGEPPPIPRTRRAPKMGMWVAALGHPYDMPYSLSVGAVSALHRGARLKEWRGRFPGFIQTDLSLNPGNSGGPLIGACGEMLGLNTAVMGSARGLSLSLPMNRLELVIKRLLREGRFERSYVGLTLKYVSYKHANRVGLPPRVGVRVKRVVRDGPGYLAGLRANDIIIQLRGKASNDESELSWGLISSPPYQSIPLEVLRGEGSAVERLSLSLSPWTLEDKQTRHTVPIP